MICLVTVRRLKPDSYHAFRRAWAPDPWPEQLQRVEVLRNDDNPDEVMTIGYVDLSAADFEAMRDDPAVLSGEVQRLERIAPFEELVLLNGVYELVEEVAPPA